MKRVGESERERETERESGERESGRAGVRVRSPSLEGKADAFKDSLTQKAKSFQRVTC